METKQWYKSKTVWAALVMVVVGTLGMFGVGNFEAEQESIVEMIMQIVTLISGVVALIGRVTAKTKVAGSSSTGISCFLVCLVMIIFAGYNQVQMSPEYAKQLEMSAINVAELSKRCNDGDPNACKAGLAEASTTLNLLVDGMYGVDSSGGE